MRIVLVSEHGAFRVQHKACRFHLLANSRRLVTRPACDRRGRETSQIVTLRDIKGHHVILTACCSGQGDSHIVDL
jgi:hypothetical protein